MFRLRELEWCVAFSYLLEFIAVKEEVAKRFNFKIA